MDVWVAGVGEIPCRKKYEHMDFREMLFEAAKKAYEDAELSPRDIDGVVASGIDFYEGVSITDSYTPDQVGGRLKFNTLVTNDSLNAFIHACMLLKTNQFRTLAVTVYSKASNILNYGEIVLNAWDPFLIRPLLPHHVVLAALDAQAFLTKNGGQTIDLSMVAAKNHVNALENSSAAYGLSVSAEEIEESEFLSEPVRSGHVADLCDYAAVIILTNSRAIGKIAVEGFGFASGSVSNDFSGKVFGKATWVKAAFQMASRMAKHGRADFIEVSEPFAHSELMVLNELPPFEGSVLTCLRQGMLGKEGSLPVNQSGGCLGMGYPLNAAGLQRVIQACKLLRTGRGSSCWVLSQDEVVDAGSIVFLRGESA